MRCYVLENLNNCACSSLSVFEMELQTTSQTSEANSKCRGVVGTNRHNDSEEYTGPVQGIALGVGGKDCQNLCSLSVLMEHSENLSI